MWPSHVKQKQQQQQHLFTCNRVHTRAHVYTHPSLFTRSRLYNYKHVSFICRSIGILNSVCLFSE